MLFEITGIETHCGLSMYITNEGLFISNNISFANSLLKSKNSINRAVSMMLSNLDADGELLMKKIGALDMNFCHLFKNLLHIYAN